MGNRVKVATTAEIPPGEGKTIEVEGYAVALFNVDGSYFAIEDTCSHVGGPLGEGELDGECVQCPWHGARFNVKTGEFIAGPKASDLSTYPVTVDGEDILIEL